jgi:hypothetical protein
MSLYYTIFLQSNFIVLLLITFQHIPVECDWNIYLKIYQEHSGYFMNEKIFKFLEVMHPGKVI